jgi:hypothetical protein
MANRKAEAKCWWMRAARACGEWFLQKRILIFSTMEGVIDGCQPSLPVSAVLAAKQCRKKVAQTGLTKILGIRTEFPQSALKSAVGLWNTTHIPRNAWMTAARAALSRSQRRCGRRKVPSSSSCIAARLAIHALSCARRAWRGL